MKRFPNRCWSVLWLFVCGTLCAQSESGRLYRAFQDPPHQYTIRPFWFWNGKLDAKQIDWQIDQMVAQGVYGAYVHNRTGLQTPYLSDAYFDAVKAAFEKSSQVGFHFGLVDEYEWPGGEARDVWLKGLPSRVLAANPEFRMRSLGYIEKQVEGPARIRLDAMNDFQFAIAAAVLPSGALDAGSLRDISDSAPGGRLDWQAPAGHWLVTLYFLHPTRGRDGGMVDLMNAHAVRKFLDLTYEQYYKRFSGYFGGVMDSTFEDHEGDYGYRIAWTPELFDTFQRTKDYDLRKYLPLLVHEGGRLTPKVRCDYLDVVSGLYSHSFFQQVSDWGKAHRIAVTGHVWEETLQWQAAFEGDLPRIMRSWGWPGVDSLLDRGRLPRDFKEAGSVAHFRGTRFTCENQGLQGADSDLDFQKMRLGTNMIAAWGVNNFVPHAFNYNQQRIEYPADWFYHEPYWKYFKHYADYTRRISFMNDGGRHVAGILIYQPLESAWAHSDPVFREDSPYTSNNWNNPVDTINAYYTEMMDRLAQERWDYDVADAYYLNSSRLEHGRIGVGNEEYKILLLPPATTIRRSALNRIRAFYDAGGTVIAIRMLPTDSMEAGENDPAVADDIRHIFGDTATARSYSHSNAAGGKAFFVKNDVDDILKLLAENLKQDVKVTSGERTHLFYLHRQKDGVDFYWMVNDSENARENTVVFAVQGKAEEWDAADASRKPLYYQNTAEGTEVRLHFAPWEAYYVVFEPGPRRPEQVEKTNLQDFYIAGADAGGITVHGQAPMAGSKTYFVEVADGQGRRYRGSVAVARALAPIEFHKAWSFQPEKTELMAPYARTRTDLPGEGESLGWQDRNYPDLTWDQTWLSRERLTVRNWSLIGPFPNDDHRGFWTQYPPEKSVDLEAAYTGAGGQEVRWTRFDSRSYVVSLNEGLQIPADREWITSYAVSYIYAPSARQAEFRIAADNNAQLWVNGQNLLDWHIHPFYYELREDFALTRTAALHPGWNEVLVKVSKGQRGRQYAFSLRVTDPQGRNFDDLIFSPAKFDISARRKPEAEPGRTWYRIPVPVSAVGVKLPPMRGAMTVFYDGRKVAVGTGGVVHFPAAAAGTGHVLAIETGRAEVIPDVPEFLLGRTTMALGSWTFSGLPYYSGSAAYEQEFDLPAEYAGRKLELDCGQVGVTAEVWVNGRPAGVRVWLPYRWDISKLVQPGRNRIKIVVTNSMENARAVENHAGKLEKLTLNGLLGPVRIVPYLEADFKCLPAPVATARRDSRSRAVVQ